MTVKCVRCGNPVAPLRFLDTNLFDPDDPDSEKNIRNYCFPCGSERFPLGVIETMRELWSSGKMGDDGLAVKPVKN